MIFDPEGRSEKDVLIEKIAYWEKLIKDIDGFDRTMVNNHINELRRQLSEIDISKDN